MSRRQPPTLRWPTPGWLGGALALSLLAAVVPAAAQVEPAAFDAQLFHPTPDAGGMLGVMTEKTPGHLAVATGIWLDLGFNSLRVGVSSLQLPRATLVTRRFDTHLIATLGVGRSLELGLELPWVMYQGGNDSAFARQVLKFDGFKSGRPGDLALHAKTTLVNEQGLRPGVAAGLNLRLPSGAETAMAGEASAVAEPFFVMAKRHGLTAMALNLGLRVRPAPEVLGDARLGHQITYGLGVATATGRQGHEHDSLLVGELAGQLPMTRDRAGVGTLEGRVALRLLATRKPGPISVACGLGIGLLRGYGQPLVRVLLAVDFVSDDPVLDTDQDGVPDIHDKCPTQPEDHDSFEDANGCPDHDNDGDGIADEDDDCPNEVGPRINDGCAVVNQADGDNDGIPDTGDKCLLESEDYDGFQDDDGCPDADNDHDGLLDYGDMCPDVAEDKNAFQDDDGCPDGGKGAWLVVLQQDGIVLNRQPTFIKDTAGLLPTSKQVLDQLATIMRDHPEVAKVKMTVFPERRSPKSRAMAAARAQAIAAYLTSRAIDATRLRIEDGAYDRHRAGRVELEATVEKVQAPLRSAPGKAPATKGKKRR
ncbi:MAG: hypothetical protein HY903_08010 [Deltaproteobacteria bacterium]|nr:hypothetical protein [Deltaproteobacteria bacterium]